MNRKHSGNGHGSLRKFLALFVGCAMLISAAASVGVFAEGQSDAPQEIAAETAEDASVKDAEEPESPDPEAQDAAIAAETAEQPGSGEAATDGTKTTETGAIASNAVDPGTGINGAASAADNSEEGALVTAPTSEADAQAADTEEISYVSGTLAADTGSEKIKKGEDGSDLRFDAEAEVSETAALPENTVFSAEEVLKEAEYTSYKKRAEDVLSALYGTDEDGNNIRAISSVRFFDMGFFAGGDEVEPADKVKIRLAFYAGLELSDGDEVEVLHFDEKDARNDYALDETAAKITAKVENDALTEISFEADQFSVYGVVVTSPVEEAVESATTDEIADEIRSSKGTKALYAASDSNAVAQDGTYSASVPVYNKSGTQAYTVTLELVVSGGKITSGSLDQGTAPYSAMSYIASTWYSFWQNISGRTASLDGLAGLSNDSSVANGGSSIDAVSSASTGGTSSSSSSSSSKYTVDLVSAAKSIISNATKVSSSDSGSSSSSSTIVSDGTYKGSATIGNYTLGVIVTVSNGKITAVENDTSVTTTNGDWSSMLSTSGSQYQLDKYIGQSASTATIDAISGATTSGGTEAGYAATLRNAISNALSNGATSSSSSDSDSGSGSGSGSSSGSTSSNSGDTVSSSGTYYLNVGESLTINPNNSWISTSDWSTSGDTSAIDLSISTMGSSATVTAQVAGTAIVSINSTWGGSYTFTIVVSSGSSSGGSSGGSSSSSYTGIITSPSSLTNGDYIIVSGRNTSYAMSGTSGGSSGSGYYLSGVSCTTTGTTSGSTATVTDSSAVWTYDSSAGSFVNKSTGQYLTIPTSTYTNLLSSSASSLSVYTISGYEGTLYTAYSNGGYILTTSSYYNERFQVAYERYLNSSYVSSGDGVYFYAVSSSSSEDTTQASSITATPSSVSVTTGSTATVTLTLTGCTVASVTSGNSGVATVSWSGNTLTITGVTAGTTSITVTGTVGDGYSTPSSITIPVTVTNASDTSGDITVSDGDAITVTKSWASGTDEADSVVATIASTDGTYSEDVTLSSSNNWTTTVSDLDSSLTYTVREKSVTDNSTDATSGYTATVTQGADTYVKQSNGSSSSSSTVTNGYTYNYNPNASGASYDSSTGRVSYTVSNRTFTSNVTIAPNVTVTFSGCTFKGCGVIPTDSSAVAVFSDSCVFQTEDGTNIVSLSNNIFGTADTNQTITAGSTLGSGSGVYVALPTTTNGYTLQTSSKMYMYPSWATVSSTLTGSGNLSGYRGWNISGTTPSTSGYQLFVVELTYAKSSGYSSDTVTFRVPMYLNVGSATTETNVTTYHNYTITNAAKDSTATGADKITVVKSWSGVTPASGTTVTASVTAPDGTSQTVTLNSGNSWTATVDADSTKTYTVVETGVTNSSGVDISRQYTSSVSGPVTTTETSTGSSGPTAQSQGSESYGNTYVLVYQSGGNYYALTASSSGTGISPTQVTVSNGVITSTVTDYMKWKVASISSSYGNYTLQNAGNSGYMTMTYNAPYTSSSASSYNSPVTFNLNGSIGVGYYDYYISANSSSVSSTYYSSNATAFTPYMVGSGSSSSTTTTTNTYTITNAAASSGSDDSGDTTPVSDGDAITVTKSWASGTTAANSVVATIASTDGSYSEDVTLNSSNNWTATVSDLDSSKTYTVTEKSVAGSNNVTDDYTVTVTKGTDTYVEQTSGSSEPATTTTRYTYNYNPSASGATYNSSTGRVSYTVSNRTFTSNVTIAPNVTVTFSGCTFQGCGVIPADSSAVAVFSNSCVFQTEDGTNIVSLSNNIFGTANTNQTITGGSTLGSGSGVYVALPTTTNGYTLQSSSKMYMVPSWATASSRLTGSGNLSGYTGWNITGTTPSTSGYQLFVVELTYAKSSGYSSDTVTFRVPMYLNVGGATTETKVTTYHNYTITNEAKSSGGSVTPLDPSTSVDSLKLTKEADKQGQDVTPNDTITLTLEAQSTGSTVTVEQTSAADILLVLDTTTSMNTSFGSGTRLSTMKTAAANFVNGLTENSDSRIAMCSFVLGNYTSPTSTKVAWTSLTSSAKSTVVSAINALTATADNYSYDTSFLTPINYVTNNMLSGNNPKYIVFFTDGDDINLVSDVQSAAQTMKAVSGVEAVYSVAITSNTYDEQKAAAIASSSDYYYNVSNASDMNTAFNNALTSITTATSSSNTSLDSLAVFKDVVNTDKFDVSGATATVTVYDYANGTWTALNNASASATAGETAGTLSSWTNKSSNDGTLTINFTSGGIVTVTGFSYKDHYLPTSGTEASGVNAQKLHVVISGIKLKSGAQTSERQENVHTNDDDSSGIYKNNSSNDPVATFPHPTVNIPAAGTDIALTGMTYGNGGYTILLIVFALVAMLGGGVWYRRRRRV